MSESRNVVRFVCLIVFSIAIGMFSVDYAEERAPALVLLSICLILGLAWISYLADQNQFRSLVRIFLLAISLRVTIVLVVHYFYDGHLFAEDDYLYDIVGWRRAQIWKGEYAGSLSLGGDRISRTMMSRELGYSYVVGVLYYIFGHVRLIPKIFNAFVGSMTVVYLARFAWVVAGDRAGRLAGVLCAVFPSLVLWSSLALKDAIASFFVVYVVWHAYCSTERFDFLGMLKIIGGVIILTQIRDYMALLLGACIALGFFLRSTKHLLRNYALGFVLIAGLFFAFQYFGYSSSYADRASLEQLNYYRKSLATGNSAIHVDADISSPGKALAYLPIGVTYFLFAPFPWMARGVRQIFAVPEVIAWYALFFSFLRGLIYVVRNRFKEMAPALIVMFLITLTYSLVEGNLGTAYRHRAQIFGFYLLITAIGLVKRPGLEQSDEVKIIPISTRRGNGTPARL